MGIKFSNVYVAEDSDFNKSAVAGPSTVPWSDGHTSHDETVHKRARPSVGSPVECCTAEGHG